MQMYAAASTGYDQTAIREMLGSTGPLTPGKFGSTMTIVPPSTAAEERDGSESEGRLTIGPSRAKSCRRRRCAGSTSERVGGKRDASESERAASSS